MGRPAKKRALALTAVAAPLLVAMVIAATSDSYTHGVNTASLGGGLVAEGDGAMLCSVGGVPVTETTSPGYQGRHGWLGALAFEGQWLWAVAHPDPVVIGPTGTSNLVWLATEDGDFELTVGEEELETGSFDAEVGVTSEVLGSDLPEDAWSEVVLTADPEESGIATAGLAFRVFCDATSPTIGDPVLTKVSGTVDLDVAAEDLDEVTILVPGQTDATAELDSSGGFAYELPDGVEPTELTVVAENLLGRTVRRRVDLEGTTSAAVVKGRTILWTSGDAEAEIDFEIESVDSKGTLEGSGVLRREEAGEVVEYELASLSGKLHDNESGSEGRKLDIDLSRSEEPKIQVSISGYLEDGLVEDATIKVDIKEVWKETFTVTFSPLGDGGNPIALATVKVAGEAEDGGPTGKVTVTTGDGTFSGASPVEFAETLRAEGYSSTVTADDDASPVNRFTRTYAAEVTWSSD